MRTALAVESILSDITHIRLPVVQFADTSLTTALKYPERSVNVNYGAVSIRNGDRIPVTIRGANSFSWKHTRRSSLPDPPPQTGTHIYYDRPSLQIALDVPYFRCSILPPSSSLGYNLTDHYFVEEPIAQVSRDHSPPIHLGRGSGLVEVEITARSECGCITKINHYLANPIMRTAAFESFLRVSPNPAGAFLNVHVETPSSDPPDNDEIISGHLHQAALTACCQEAQRDPLYYLRPQPACCRELASQLPPGPGPSREDLFPPPMPATYTYVLRVYSLSDGADWYNERFTLTVPAGDTDPVGRTINVNTGNWPRGLYAVKVVSENEGGSYASHTVILTH